MYPILFDERYIPMILSGDKTVTRRIISKQPLVSDVADYPNCRMCCPFGSKDNILYVRERWKLTGWDWDDSKQRISYTGGESRWMDSAIEPIMIDDEEFEAWLLREYARVVEHPSTRTIKDDTSELGESYQVDEQALPWRPGIHMPRWASRIHLRVIDARPIRLQDMGEAEALKEGVTQTESGLFVAPGLSAEWKSALEAFKQLWNHTQGVFKTHHWNDNPYVWRVEFERLPEPEATRVMAYESSY